MCMFMIVASFTMGSGASAEPASSRPSTVQKVNVKPAAKASNGTAHASTPRKKNFQEVEIKNNNNKQGNTTSNRGQPQSNRGNHQSSRKPEDGGEGASGGGGSKSQKSQQQVCLKQYILGHS